MSSRLIDAVFQVHFQGRAAYDTVANSVPNPHSWVIYRDKLLTMQQDGSNGTGSLGTPDGKKQLNLHHP